VVVLSVLALTSLEAAQERPTFQVVSIRTTAVAAGTPAPRSAFTILPDGRFEARGATIGDLARVAFGFEQMDARSGVVDAPNILWADRDRFDVTAAAEVGRHASPAADLVVDAGRVPWRVLPGAIVRGLRSLLTAD